MANLFLQSEEIVYINIVGDPIFDIYDDDGWIQYDYNEIYGQEVDKLSDEVIRQNIFFLMDGSNLKQDNSRFGSCGANWAFVRGDPIRAFVKGDPVRAFTHHRNKEEHVDCIKTLDTKQQNTWWHEEFHHGLVRNRKEVCHWMVWKKRKKLIGDYG
ncbi:hypothetical protein Bca101_084296 [Brassica carinata]